MVVIGHFEKKVMVSEFLGSSAGTNLFNLSADAMEEKITEIVKAQMMEKGGDGAVNVKIEYSASFLDILLNGLTCSIYAPAHLYIEGDIIKFGDGATASAETEMSVKDAVGQFKENLEEDLMAYLEKKDMVAKN